MLVLRQSLTSLRPISKISVPASKISYSNILTKLRMSTSAKPINYNNRIFRSSSNTPNGEVSAATTFHYNQDDSSPSPIVWATYSGGSIARGFFIATVQSDSTLNARYQHVNTSGELMTGKCKSTPELLKDGRIRLHESWEWTSGDRSKGESVVEEVKGE